jgi:hypothetical protein
MEGVGELRGEIIEKVGCVSQTGQDDYRVAESIINWVFGVTGAVSTRPRAPNPSA